MIQSETLYCQVDESIVKAAFLERFTRFVEWPEETGINDSTKNFVIGIYGESDWQNIIEEVYKFDQIKIKNKNIEIRYLKKISDVEKLHLLLISSSEDELHQILKVTMDKPILTVSNSEGFAEKGVLINFFVKEGKVRFEINEKAVHKSKLVMSYLLLRMAKIVNPKSE